MRVGPLREGTFPSRCTTSASRSILGIALGIAFSTCFATGLISHFAQHPLHLGFLSMPASPAWLYRWTQGLHVISGTAAIPLLMAKLWAVFPKLFTLAAGRERRPRGRAASLFPLVAGSVFQLFSGLANTARWYPWQFNFTVTHYWTAWIVIGALIVHIGAKITIARRAVAREAARRAASPQASRRAAAAGSSWPRRAAVAAVTVDDRRPDAAPAARSLALLAPRRPDVGPQGFPVNKSAIGARVTEAARDPALRAGGRRPGAARAAPRPRRPARAAAARGRRCRSPASRAGAPGRAGAGSPVRDLLEHGRAPAERRGRRRLAAAARLLPLERAQRAARPPRRHAAGARGQR